MSYLYIVTYTHISFSVKFDHPGNIENPVRLNHLTIAYTSFSLSEWRLELKSNKTKQNKTKQKKERLIFLLGCSNSIWKHHLGGFHHNEAGNQVVIWNYWCPSRPTKSDSLGRSCKSNHELNIPSIGRDLKSTLLFVSDPHQKFPIRWL